MTTFRIRKGYKGITGPYIICDADGYPLYDVQSLQILNREIKSIEKFSILKDERKKYPNLEGIPGDCLYDKIRFCCRRTENQNRAPKIFGYARVSTAGQAKSGYSLEDQEKQLLAAGAEEVYKEAFTGTTTDRPKLDELNQILKAGDTLVVTKLDRIARSVSQGTELIEDLLKRGIKVQILNMGLIDNSATGRLIRNIMLSFAEFERDMIVERTQEGKAIAKQNPDFKEGRPRKFSQRQVDHAMELLQDYSYTQVSEMTGISRATLVRRRKEYRNFHR